MSRFRKLEIDGADAAAAGSPRAAPAATVVDERAQRDPLEAGRRAFDEGAWELALRHYSRALADEPRNEEAWLGQVLVLVHLGENREAITWADRALATVPQCADLVALKAVAWARQGDVRRAAGFSDAALAMPTATALSWWARGDIHLTSSPSTAEHCFRKAMERQEDAPRIALWIGLSLLAADRPAEARLALLKATSLAPQSAVAALYLGHACREAGLEGEARRAFARARDMRPRWSAPRTALVELDGEPWWTRAWRAVRGTARR